MEALLGTIIVPTLETQQTKKLTQQTRKLSLTCVHVVNRMHITTTPIHICMYICTAIHAYTVHTYVYIIGNIHKIITEYYISPRKGSNTMAPHYIHKHRQYIQKKSDNDPLKYHKYIQCKYIQSAMNLEHRGTSIQVNRSDNEH